MHYDYILVGGGLQNGLIALALLDRRPGSRIALVEKASILGGNHIWCFHAADVAQDTDAFVAPLVAHRWPGYEVAFPGLHRDLASSYAGVTSERLDQVVGERVAAAAGCDLLLDATAVRIEADRVELGDGRVLTGELVVDARGPERAGVDGRSTGYQKFAGLELQLEAPHGLTRPVLMDATVPQIDGFRFVYTLPLAPDRLLVEDTYFSDTPDLDHARVLDHVRAYAANRGWAGAREVREESGVLPLPWQGDCAPGHVGPLVAGYQGGWFHPVTGYSFPVALRLADYISRTPVERVFGPGLRALAQAQQKQLDYCYWLNKMLFQWFAPADRYNVLERFYRLPEDLIRRFYALTLTTGDRARILVGRPPRGLSLRAALASRSAR